jgi:hypothetical protein
MFNSKKPFLLISRKVFLREERNGAKKWINKKRMIIMALMIKIGAE